VCKAKKIEVISKNYININLQQFANAFKREVVVLDRRNALGVGATANFFDDGYDYIPGNCAIIEQWWNNGLLPDNLGIGAPGGVGRGTVGNDNWFVGEWNNLNHEHSVIGSRLGILYNLGLEAENILSENIVVGMFAMWGARPKNILVNHPDTGAPLRGFEVIRAAMVARAAGPGGDAAWITAFKAAAVPANAYDAVPNDNILAYRKTSTDGTTHVTTGAQGAAARNGGWAANEIQLLDDGTPQINDGGWQNYDWKANTKANWKAIIWRNTMVGPGAGPRNTALNDPADNALMDNWFALTVSGGGGIADASLTAANARALWDNNWDAIDVHNDGHGQPAITHPDGAAGEIVGFAQIQALGNKNNLAPVIHRFYFTTTWPNHDKIQTAIDNIKSQMSGNPSVTDSELNSGLGVSNWEEYIKESESEDDLSSRESQALAAINTIKQSKTPKTPDLNQLWQAAMDAVNQHWKDKAGSDAGKINSKSKDEVLTSNWYQNIKDQKDEPSINAERDRLIALIDAEKTKEKISPSYSPSFYYPQEDSSKEDEKPKEDKKASDQKEDEEPLNKKNLEGKEPKDEKPLNLEETIEEVKQSIVNELDVSRDTVDQIMEEPRLVYENNEEESKKNIKKVQAILADIKQALDVKRGSNVKKIDTLLERLKSYQEDDSVACRAVKSSQNNQLTRAVSHLEKLKANQEFSTQELDKSWWAKQSTGTKAAIIGGIVLGIGLIGVGLYFIKKSLEAKKE
jgi:hypothetical protein